MRASVAMAIVAIGVAGCGVVVESGAIVESGPVHIDIVDTRIERGHVTLFLSRRISVEWWSTFLAETGAPRFFERVPEVWRHKRSGRVSITAFTMLGDKLEVRDAPGDAASFRQLMLAVRDAVARTNAAAPSDDPPRADRRLNPVLEEVFAADSSG